MKTRLALLASIVVWALPAQAQTAAVAQPQAQPAKAPAAAAGAKTLTAAAPRRDATAPAGAQRITAAGNVIVLADGIVANATVVPVQPPAPGFVYER